MPFAYEIHSYDSYVLFVYPVLASDSYTQIILNQISKSYIRLVYTVVLSDISENFRKNRIKTYKLDPLHYHSASGLTTEAILKLTDVKLEFK